MSEDSVEGRAQVCHFDSVAWTLHCSILSEQWGVTKPQ